MKYPELDRRKHLRRLLQVPVICYPSGSEGEPQQWIFGRTMDVGIDGLRIRCRSTLLPEPGIELDLLILNHDGQNPPHQADVPACIHGRVAWVEQTQQVFGVEYIKSC